MHCTKTEPACTAPEPIPDAGVPRPAEPHRQQWRRYPGDETDWPASPVDDGQPADPAWLVPMFLRLALAHGSWRFHCRALDSSRLEVDYNWPGAACLTGTERQLLQDALDRFVSSGHVELDSAIGNRLSPSRRKEVLDGFRNFRSEALRVSRPRVFLSDAYFAFLAVSRLTLAWPTSLDEPEHPGPCGISQDGHDARSDRGRA
jgi:hypothetical protein